jgi:hypothetical protein
MSRRDSRNRQGSCAPSAAISAASLPSSRLLDLPAWPGKGEGPPEQTSIEVQAGHRES